MTKDVKDESNTRYAQGGVAAVWNSKEDHAQKHIADTLDAGDGLCKEVVVKMVVEEGPIRVRELIEWGTRFDKEKSGEYDLGREGGHSENRILHYKDITGWEIQRTLIEKSALCPNIQILENYFAIDLLTQHHLGFNITRLTPDIECYGVYALDKSNLEKILIQVSFYAIQKFYIISNQQYVIHIEYQKCYRAPTHFLVNTGFTVSLYKTICFDHLIKAYIPSPRCLHQSIDGSLELVHFVSTFRIDKTFWLHHIQFFFKKSIKECSFDIHLPDFIKCDNC
jgi:hypothetical protein